MAALSDLLAFPYLKFSVNALYYKTEGKRVFFLSLIHKYT